MELDPFDKDDEMASLPEDMTEEVEAMLLRAGRGVPLIGPYVEIAEKYKAEAVRLRTQVRKQPKRKAPFVRPMIASVMFNGPLSIGAGTAKHFGIHRGHDYSHKRPPQRLRFWRDLSDDLVFYGQVITGDAEELPDDEYWISLRSGIHAQIGPLFYNRGYDPRVKKISFRVEEIDLAGVQTMKFIGAVEDRPFTNMEFVEEAE